MRLAGSTGDFIELTVAGYQYPHIRKDEYDSNWLLIDTQASARGRTWVSRDACLLTWELEWLAHWFEQLANGNTSDSESSFLEPNLSFELAGVANDRIRLRVYFELENRPAWAPADGASMEDLWADLDCSREELLKAAEDLRMQRLDFPPRAGVGEDRDRLPNAQ